MEYSYDETVHIVAAGKFSNMIQERTLGNSYLNAYINYVKPHILRDPHAFSVVKA